MVIGIVGGGQLGLMMAEAAIPLGHDVIGLDPDPRCPLSHVAHDMVVASFDDRTAIDVLAARVDVLTYEFENVDETLLAAYEHMLPQTTNALAVAKDRWQEKSFATACGIPTPRYHRYRSVKDGFAPSVIKTTKGGYDGKGQYRIRALADLRELPVPKDDFTFLIEDYVPFDYEISVIATRGKDGSVVTYPVPVNTHAKGILRSSTIGNELPESIVTKAMDHTTKLITSLSYIGTLTVECFVINNTVLFNEFAPRPHNSGHYTIEACNVSQFENHIRAITGMEVVAPHLKQPAVMLNELGEDPPFASRPPYRNCTHHDYRKTERREGRKMGHLTCLLDPDTDWDTIQNHYLGETDGQTTMD